MCCDSPCVNYSVIQQRIIVAFFTFLALAIVFMQTTSILLTMTEMTWSPVVPDVCNHSQPPSTPEEYEFNWSETLQGIILSSFFWGYCISHVPGGMLADRFGGSLILGIGVLVASTAQVLIPQGLRWGDYPVFLFLRFVTGVGQGCVNAAAHVVASHWVLPQERASVGTFIFVGGYAGIIFSNILAATLLHFTHDLWPLIFYLSGGLGLLWGLIWLCFVYEKPLENPHLSQEERALFEIYTPTIHLEAQKRFAPWPKMLKSMPVWSLVLAQFGSSWGQFTLGLCLPKYMKQVLHFSVLENGLLTVIPIFVTILVAIGAGILVDWLIKTDRMSVTRARKTFFAVSYLISASAIIGASYQDCYRFGALSMLLVGMVLSGFYYPTLKVNVLDLSPTFAGALGGLVQGVGTGVAGILNPIVNTNLTSESTFEEWHKVYWLTFGMMVFGVVVFVIGGSGKVQRWDSPKFLPTTIVEERPKLPRFFRESRRSFK